MKYSICTFLTLFIFSSSLYAQLADEALIKKLSINGYCLCKTTVTELKTADSALKEVKVEEMDLPPNCFGQDTRFIAGKGYYSDKHPGIVFQKDQNSNYISKIRLIKDFKGNLPDGQNIDLSVLKLRDVLKMYPKLNDAWGSRDCSAYWKFSDDTLAFYVKIDSLKKPQLPIDKSYYYDKPVEAIDLVVSCYKVVKADADKLVNQIVSADPVFIVDSLRINKSDLAKYDPNDIATVTVLKPKSAIDMLGPAGSNGAILAETKKYVQTRLWRFLTSQSAEYAKVVLTPDQHNTQYIINGKVLSRNWEGDAGMVINKNLKSIIILDKNQLVSRYNITDKDIGVVIIYDK